MMSVYDIYYYFKTNNPNKHAIYEFSLKNIDYYLPILMLTFKMRQCFLYSKKS